MPSRRLSSAALALALIAPVSAMSASASAASPSRASKGKVPAAKHLPRPTRHAAKQAHDPHRVLVKFRSSAPKARRDSAVTSHGGRVGQALPGTGFVEVTTSGRAEDLARRLKTDPAVAQVALDYVRQASATPNDPNYIYQHYLDTVRAPTAWDRSKGSLTQVVAVIDTGVDGTHPDLQGHTVAGYNAITKAGIAAGVASDDNGHGSMVSGIIAAGTGNGTGIAGVAWNAKVMPVKVLDSNGYGDDSDVVEGISWAVSHGAKIINLSLGGDADSPVLHDAVSNAVANGAVVVVAAGNSGDDVPEYPAAYPEAVAVAATDTSGALTDFSTFGPWVDVAAPGFGILSTTIADASGNENYAYGDGTSFAAPIVSGVVALMRSQTPSLTPAQVLQRLRSTARDAGPRGSDPYYGAGIVDATDAVGGGWAPGFGRPAMGADEPNDLPARATPLTGSTTATLGVEGDTDWYRVDTTATQPLSVTVTPAAWDPNLPQNADPVVSVYDSALRPLAVSDHHGSGEPELVGWTAPAGVSYVKAQSFNGARDPRPYTVALARHEGALLDSPSWLEQATPQAGSTAVGDVTGDGRDDVVTVLGEYGDAVTPRGIIVYAQTAAGDLDEGTFYPTANDSPVMRLAVGDVDGDGAAEVLAGTFDGLQVFHRLPDGTLAAPQYSPGISGSQVHDVTTGDLDGDGRPDLVVSLNGSPYIRIRQADGSYYTAAHFQISMQDLSIADVDGDGRPDVVGAGGGGVIVLHNDPAVPAGWRMTTVPVSPSLPSGSGVGAARSVDVNGDGRSDVVALEGTSDGSLVVATYLQAADGTLQASTTSPLPSHSVTLEVADFTGDGIPDVVTSTSGQDATVSVLPGLGGGGFGAPASTALGDSVWTARQGELATVDLHRDGHPDVALMTRTGVAVLRNTTTTTPAGPDQLWVQSSTPSDVATGLAQAAAPTVTFARDITATSVTGSTVHLVDGRTGSDVPASIAYDATTRTATVTPAALLGQDAPYRLTVSGVTDTSGATMDTAYSSTFETVDPAPSAVGSFTATGAVRAATLTWKATGSPEVNRYIVRMAAGTTPPAGITSGTDVYSGSGTSVTLPYLAQGSTFSFRIWAQDRSGTLGPASSRTLAGTAPTMSASVTSLTNGGAVSLSSRLTRRDTGAAITGVPVQLYWRKVGTTTWYLLTTPTTGSTGTVSFVSRPGASLDYQWVYRGSGSFIGSSSPAARVGVRTTVTGAVSRTSLALGGSFTVSGSVAPTHAGQVVYLQRYAGNGAWTTVASRTLSSTSTYAVAFRPGWRGTFTFRMYKPADVDHLASYSPNRVVKVY
ncbi:hypothetical protein GCM10009817_37520 [Terrabacter lapilli]|uniref:Fibronectin type-III domain-containing protein n=1 Tax=Terrabacter lapilli TaxID=436231 RepID=A0ABN2SSP9_9MICO